MSFNLIIEDKKIEKQIKPNQTINNLLKELEISPQTVVVKKNNQIVTEDTIINNNDTIKIIQIIYGG